MVVYATNADTTVSSTVIVALGTIALFAGMAEVLVDLFFPDEV
jgi:hypothetical protein